jgi:hypothetical protein
MSRLFDGADDHLNGATNASIDAFTQRTISMWIKRNTTGAGIGSCLMAKDRYVTGFLFGFDGGHTDKLYLQVDFSTTDGSWTSDTLINTTGVYHIAVTYDGSSSSNDPIFYINGVQSTVTEVTTPVGTLGSDAAVNLMMGETGPLSSDYNGHIENALYHNTIYNAADINICRWWGCLGKAVKCHYTLYTSKLTNEGNAIADLSAVGTTVSNLATPVVRPGQCLMGMGIGW